ncbi:MAG: flippase [Gemmatimonadetes bacterium]|nr:flippase [Gemmatimonadota bacterium]
MGRNTLWNLGGQGVSLVAGVVAMPVIVRHLGEQRFGVLALVWAVLGYFALFDFGLGRATTKFVAEQLERAPDAAGPLITRAVLAQLAMGLAGGVALAATTPMVVHRILSVPAVLEDETRAACYVLAGILPFVLLFSGLRAALEATQRFDLVNVIRTPATAASFIVPAALAPFGVGLVGIIATLGITRVAASGATVIALRRTIPGFRWTLRGTAVPLRDLLNYGGWVAVSNAVNPVLLYFDRFLLGGLAGVAAVGYYAPPYEAVTRLLVIPGALTTALFPAFSILLEQGKVEETGRLVRKSVAVLALVFALFAVVIGVFAAPLLDLWLGAAFAREGAMAMRLLAVAVFVNALAHVPNIWLYAAGRPDLPAKFQGLELPLYVLTSLLLVRRWGVTGAAAAWSLRVGFDAVLTFAAAYVVRRRRSVRAGW